MRATTDQERAAHARWRRKRRQLLSAGQWRPFVDADPVREWIRRIREAGMPVRALEAAVGLHQCALDYLLWGDSQRPTSNVVRAETADAVLAFWPTLDDFPDGARICPVGSRRRLQSLIRQGWTFTAMAAHSGVCHGSLKHVLDYPRITASMARKVRALYDDLWDRVPEDAGIRPWIADRNRAYGERQGWPTSLAWDDDTIDDPATEPQLDADPPAPAPSGQGAADRWLMGESVVLGEADRRLVVAYLMEWSPRTVESIAAQLELPAGSVSRSWERIKSRARAEGQPVPRRRAYITPVREKTRSEAA